MIQHQLSFSSSLPNKKHLKLFLSLLALLFISKTASATVVPVFTRGAVQNVIYCANTNPIIIDTLLTVNDDNTTDTLTWSMLTAPSRGSLSILPFTDDTSLTVFTTPNGSIRYSPLPGTIMDSFDVQVSNGVDIATTRIIVTIKPIPHLTSGLTPGGFCNGDTFTYRATFDLIGTTFSCERPLIAGIGNIPATFTTDSIAEVIDNSTDTTIRVSYIYIMENNGCADTQTVVVNANPIPTLSSSVTPPAACSYNAYSYINTSATPGARFSWHRDSVAGISNSARSGMTDTIIEHFVNTTDTALMVTYMDTVRANGCMSTATITLTVNPTARLASGRTPSPICDGSNFMYVPTATIGNTTFSWRRDTVIGLSNATTTGIDTINEVLNNTLSSTVSVPYYYELSDTFGCRYSDTVSLSVNPTPRLTGSLADTICDNATYRRMLTSATTGTMIMWHRDTVRGISNAMGHSSDSIVERLINTTNAPVLVVYLDTLMAAGCMSTTSTTLLVKPTPVNTTTLTNRVCSGAPYSYNYVPSVSGSSVTWVRNAVVGVANPTQSSITDSIRETLTDTVATSVAVIYNATISLNGCSSNRSDSVWVHPIPVLRTSLTPAGICDSTLFNYPAASATPGTVITWSRAAVSGIANAANSGTGNPNEVLDNTNANTIPVMYVDTLRANGCSNIQNVTVNVYPTPLLSSSTTATPVCDSVLFAYTYASLTAGTTYLWSRNAVPGIVNITSVNNAGNITEYLDNDTTMPVVVVYTITLTANGCSHSQTMNVTINPSPKLSSALTATRCSGSAFTYTPTSATTGTSYSWARATMAGITPVGSSGSNNINETLINTTNTAKVVPYVYNLSANGCSKSQTINLTVNPIPARPVIAIRPNDTVCLNSGYHNVGILGSSDTTVRFTWGARNATLWSSGSGRVNALVDFNMPGKAIIYVQSYIKGSPACYSQDSVSVYVRTTGATRASVWYFQNRFACIPAVFDSYQWGYDDQTTLDSTLLPGETDQDYYCPSPLANKLYWVITTNGGCRTKTYLSNPLGISPATMNGEVSVTLFPNPAEDILNVEINTLQYQGLDIAVVDITGKQLAHYNVGSKNNAIDVSSLQNGMYFVVTSQNGVKLNTSKFIKN